MHTNIKINTTACFIGHRSIKETQELKNRLYEIIEILITKNGVDTFLFGSKSRFNSLCLEIVSLLKEKYPQIKRIYLRAEYPVINDSYENYLLEYYEQTYYPERLKKAGRAVYVERNFEMIEKSNFCIFYYNEQNAPTNRKSGTKIAIDYAKTKKKQIINVFG